MKRPGTKERILQASIDLFFEHGFAKASMRDIADQAGVTLSSSYNHFKNKYDILYTIVMGIGTALLEALDKATQGSTTGCETLEVMIVTQLGLIRKRAKEIKIYLEEQYQLPPELRSIVLEQHREIYDRYFNQVAAIEEEGLLKPINKTVITFSILAMVNWAYRWFREDGELSMEEIAQDIVEFCLGGIVANENRPRRCAVGEKGLNG